MQRSFNSVFLFCILFIFSTTALATTVTRCFNVGPYHSIYAKGPYQLVLTRDPLGSPIQITGHKGDINLITRKVDHQTLMLTNSLPTRPVTIRIPVGNNDSLTATLAGQASMNTTDLVFDTINIQMLDSAHAEVLAKTWLNAAVHGCGTIYYRGSPTHINAQSYDAGTIVELTQ